MRHYLKLLVAFIRYSLAREIMFKVNFSFNIFVYLIWTIFSVITIKVFYGQTESIGIFTEAHTICLLGTYLMVNSLMSFFAIINISDLPLIISRGELDFYITKPVNTIFITTLRRSQFMEVFGFIFGIAVTVYGLSKINFNIDWASFILYLLLLCCGVIVYYSIWLIAHTLSFWLLDISNMEALLSVISDLSRFPFFALGRMVKFISLTFIPVALISNLPVLALFGQLSWYWVIYVILFTVVIFSLAILFFNFAVKRYSSASS